MGKIAQLVERVFMSLDTYFFSNLLLAIGTPWRRFESYSSPFKDTYSNLKQFLVNKIFFIKIFSGFDSHKLMCLEIWGDMPSSEGGGL